MPYFIRKRGGEHCVIKGTKDNPGETVKCHPTKEKARAHLGALYVHVEDAGVQSKQEEVASNSSANVGDLLESAIHKSFTTAADMLFSLGYLDRDERIKLSSAVGDSLGVMSAVLDNMNMRSRLVGLDVAHSLAMSGGVFFYKEGDADRWIAVSTIEDWDKQGELFTKEAMDYDVARVTNGGKYPNLRMFHVRGFRLGICDSMQRIDGWAVDQGDWLKTRFAQWTKDDVIDNPGKWKISRGFYSVRATGQCPGCGTGLVVGPWNYIFGVRCTACKELHSSPSGLKRLKHLRAITFDITLTDVPAVSGTAVAAYSIQKGGQ